MTTCKLRTVETEMPLNIADQMHTKKVNQIIMHAGLLKDALGELDWSADAVEVVLSQSEPYFKLSTNGKAGSSAVNRIDALLRRSFFSFDSVLRLEQKDIVSKRLQIV